MIQQAFHDPSLRGRRLLLIGAGRPADPADRSAPGVANRLWHFLKPLLAAGYACRVVSIESGGGGGPGPLETREAAGLQWDQLSVGAEALLDEPRAAGALSEMIRRYRPEALFGAGTLLASAGACTLAGERPVWADLFGDPLAEIHAKAAIAGDEAHAEQVLQVWQLMLRVLVRADAFSVVSRRQADALLGQLALAGRPLDPAHERIHVLPCGLEALDLPEPPEPADPALWRREFGLPPEARVILWSGGFNAWADPETLLAGAERLMDRDERVHLVATGAGLPGYLGAVHQRFEAGAAASRHSDRIHRLGWLPRREAHQWLRAADVGVLVDRPCAETRLGARNRLLYYAAADLPGVATRGTELVEQMGAANALVTCPPARPEALAEALQQLLRDPGAAAQIARNARRFTHRYDLFDATAEPLLAFAACPERFPAGTHASEAAARSAARFLDVRRRQAEWLELQRLRERWPCRLMSKLGAWRRRQ